MITFICGTKEKITTKRRLRRCLGLVQAPAILSTTARYVFDCRCSFPACFTLRERRAVMTKKDLPCPYARLDSLTCVQTAPHVKHALKVLAVQQARRSMHVASRLRQCLLRAWCRVWFGWAALKREKNEHVARVNTANPQQRSIRAVRAWHRLFTFGMLCWS